MAAVPGAATGAGPAHDGPERVRRHVAVQSCTLPQMALGQLRLGDLDLRAVSLQGELHIACAEPRQDAYGTLASRDGSWLCAGVADGIGSKPHSAFGADSALRRGLRRLAWSIADRTGVVDPVGVVEAAARGAAARASALGVDPTEVATTLVLAAVEVTPAEDGSRTCTIISVGDSHALVLRSGGAWEYLTPQDDSGPSNLVSHHLPVAPGEPVVRTVDLLPGDVLVLATDGFTTPLADGEGELGRELARRWLPEPRLLLPFLVDVMFEGYHDDRTVVAVWCPAVPQAAPVVSSSAIS
jgi:serine/threonine protein phosphatase PrpC